MDTRRYVVSRGDVQIGNVAVNPELVLPFGKIFTAKYKVNCYNYKIWSSETIQNWSKLQEWLKSSGNLNFSSRKQASILRKIEKGEL